MDSEHEEDTSLVDLQKEYETIVASLTACIKGLKALKPAAAAEKRVRKGGVTKTLHRVLDKAGQDAAVAGTSYGTAVLEALEGAELVHPE